MKKLLFPLFLVSIFASCNSEPKPVLQDEKTKEKNVTASDLQSKDVTPPPQKTVADFQKVVHCEKINFNVTAENQEITTIHVSSENLSIREYQQDFTVEGQLKFAFGTDQNDDGFCELYLVVQQTDDSGNLDIIGVASFNDKSAGEITIKDVQLPRRQNSDKVYVHYDKLRREFYDEKGELHIYIYELQKGEAGFILQALRYK